MFYLKNDSLKVFIWRVNVKFIYIYEHFWWLYLLVFMLIANSWEAKIQEALSLTCHTACSHKDAPRCLPTM